MAEILGKLAEEIAVDFRSMLRRVNGEMNVVGSHQRRGRREDQQAKNRKDATHHTSPRSTGRRWSAGAGAPRWSWLAIFGHRSRMPFRNPRIYTGQARANKPNKSLYSFGSTDYYAHDSWWWSDLVPSRFYLGRCLREVRFESDSIRDATRSELLFCAGPG